LANGTGLDAAVDGVDVIVHAASNPARQTEEVDVRGTERVLRAAHTAGVRHLIYVSIAGIDHIPFSYYQHKLAAEEVVTAGPVPWTIVRATQFHSFLDSILDGLARLPLLMPLPPSLQFQPVATGEVAAQLAKVVHGGPAGRLPDIGGPEVHTLGELARIWLEIRDRRRLLVPLPLPGKVANAFRKGYATVPERKVGQITWEAWLRRESRMGEKGTGENALAREVKAA
jgi:uncharacterized protein YbjT (DUF2867 family)